MNHKRHDCNDMKVKNRQNSSQVTEVIVVTLGDKRALTEEVLGSLLGGGHTGV